MSKTRFVAELCRLSILFAVAVGLTSDTARAFVAPAQSRDPVLSTREDTLALAHIREKLTWPVTLEFVETPLSDVVDFVKDYTGVNIVVDHIALEKEGASADTLVSIHVHNIKLASALTHLLRPHKLSWILQDDCLILTSQIAADNSLVTRSYPVSDLAQTPEDAAKLVAIANRVLGAARRGDVGERMQLPDSLKALVLTDSPSAHARIARLCEQLRSGSADPDTVKAIKAKLTEPITLEFVETPISDVVDFLKDYTGLNILLDRAPLDAEGVNSDTPVSIHVQSIDLRSALSLLLSRHNLTFQIEDECLMITSKLTERTRFSLQAYPVGKMLTGQSTLSGEDWLRLANSVVPGVTSETRVGEEPNSAPQPVIGFYEPSQTLIVFGPDSLQEKVAALIGLVIKTAERSPK